MCTAEHSLDQFLTFVTFGGEVETHGITTKCDKVLHLVHWIHLDSFFAAVTYKQNEGEFWKRFHKILYYADFSRVETREQGVTCPGSL